MFLITEKLEAGSIDGTVVVHDFEYAMKRWFKPHSHCADVATVHPDAGQPVYRDAPGHIS